MKICAITMVYKDYWALSQWYRHYSKHLCVQHLYVISHGYDPKVAKICAGASVITVPRDSLVGFDRVRFDLINSIQAGLLNLYDWVIQTDADELICIDPTQYASFEKFFSAQAATALFGLGLNLAEIDGDEKLGKGSVFAKRSVASVSGNFSKAFAVRKPIRLRWHGVSCEKDQVKDFEFSMPDGVYLCHIKFANLIALEETNKVRRQVSMDAGDTWKTRAWIDPVEYSMRFFRKLAASEHLNWDEAVSKGYDVIRNNTVRDEGRGLVKSPFIDYICRTTLPKWFKEY